jgi:transposase
VNLLGNQRPNGCVNTALGLTKNRIGGAIMADSLNNDSVEIWKPVPGWEGLYEVCLSTQQVRSIRRRRIMKPWRFPSGYITVHFRRPGESVQKYLHQIVCEVAHGPMPEGKECVRHLNGNARDNRPENLAWGTMKENARDMVEHGTSCRGRRNARNTMSEEDVLGIRRAAVSGESQASIAERYGITQGTVSQIVRGERWGWLEGAPIFPARAKEFANATLNEEKVREIRRRYASGEKQAVLAKEYGVTFGNISCIVLRKSWKHVE